MEEYKTVALQLKDEANEAFQKGDIEKSIDLYSQAINVDPDNHILYSNRSAAYMKADSKSKALKDAERCVELAPEWSKGYTRLGAAQQSLKRFDAAIESYKNAIKYDKTNASLWSSLSACQDAYEKDKQHRFEEAKKEREIEEERIKQADSMKLKQQQIQKENELKDFLNSIGSNDTTSSTTSTTTTTSSSKSQDEQSSANPAANTEDDLLSGFFNEIQTKQNEIKSSKEHTLQSVSSSSVSKYATQELGDAETQYNRLTQKNYEWRNLNPYYVLQLGIDATDEDIKQRYKNLSRKVHPDKLQEKENAREAFEQVKTAYQKLMDEKQRQVIIMNIEYVRDEYNKDRKRLISKGLKEENMPKYEEELERRTIKHFAEIEMQKRRSETNLRFYNARERIQEDEEKEKLRKEEEKEKEWADIERRERRVGDWRDFQTDPEAKKVKLSSYKEEHRDSSKHGKIELETWKKSWK